jgi:hypothetical protein
MPGIIGEGVATGEPVVAGVVVEAAPVVELGRLPSAGSVTVDVGASVTGDVDTQT